MDEAKRKRLANLKSWRKGQSGNPKGRPPELKAIVELARTYTQPALHTVLKLMLTSKKDEVRLRAAEAILDRGWGKSPQAIQVGGLNGEAIPVRLVQEIVSKASGDSGKL